MTLLQASLPPYFNLQKAPPNQHPHPLEKKNQNISQNRMKISQSNIRHRVSTKTRGTQQRKLKAALITARLSHLRPALVVN